MHRISLCLVPLWLFVALVLLVLDGCLVLFLVCAVPSSAAVIVAIALIRDQRKASIAESRRYRVADDLGRPMADVVADAEAAAELPIYRLGGGIMRWQ
jgi:hypothetical protein